MKKICLILLSATLILGLTGCGSQKYKDGTYKAEASASDEFGWKAYVELDTQKDKIVSVVFNYMNDKTGLTKTEDIDYNKQMKANSAVDPVEYTLRLQNSLLQKQDIDQIDAVTGASISSRDMKILAQAALDKAKTGDTTVAEVDMPEYN